MTQTLTPPGGANAAFIEQQLPNWLKYSTRADLQRLRDTQIDPQYTATGLADWFTWASPQQQQTLLDCQHQLRHAKRRLAGLLKHLKGITAFAEPLLKQRLKADFGLDIDVNTAQFMTISREWTFNGRWQKLTEQRQSLLQAALQNFPAGASFDADTSVSKAGLYEVKNETVYEAAIVTVTDPIAITAAEFARTCHDLDIGARYQQHLSEVYDNPLVSSRIRYHSIDLAKQLLRAQTHVAYMKSEIGSEARNALLSLLDGHQAPLFHGAPVTAVQLTMYGIELADTWMLSGGAQGAAQLHPVIVYLPGAPLYPLKEYPSIEAFKDDVRINLSQTAYQALFRGYAGQEQQASFSRILEQHLFPEGLDGGFSPDANLKLRSRPMPTELFKALQDQHAVKLRADARMLAVPSAAADAAASAARLAYWEGLGMDGLNLAAFFVPVLGQVMALVVAEQLVLEVVDGAQDWSNGDRSSAWAHFEALALNLAIGAGLGAGLKVTETLAASLVLDELVSIQLPSGERRLWRADLRPYAKAVELGEALPDAQGLYTVDDKQYVRIDEKTYPVVRDEHGDWRIETGVPEAYQPLLSSNGQGAWQAYGEFPLQWDRRQLLRRLGPVTDGLSDTELARTADNAGIGDDLLRKVHVDGSALPAELGDGLRRLRLERRVSALIEGVRADTARGADLGYVAPLAVELPHWPERVIEVFKGPELWGESIVYGRDRFESGAVIRISRDDLYAGKLAQIIVAGLDEAAAQRFFGDSVPVGERAQVLREKLGDRMAARRASVADSLNASSRAPRSVAVKCLQRDFPGLGDEAATQVVADARSAELDNLNATPGKVPLRVAEQARISLRRQRLTRAIEGLAEANLATLDSDRLALKLLEKLPGWTGKVRIELRDLRVDGALLEAIGPQDGELKTLVRGEGFRIHDAAGLELGLSRHIDEALLRALPDSERVALGFDSTHAADLRAALRRQALSDRGYVAQAIGERASRPWFKQPLNHDERVGYRLSGNPQAAAGAVGGRHSLAVLRRARRLYPNMSEAGINDFLDELSEGGTPLLPALEQRLAELRQLNADLDAWVRTPQHLTLGNMRPRPVHAGVLETVAREIRRAYQRETPIARDDDGIPIGHQLSLRGVALDRLPELSADLSHITYLNLGDMGIRDVPEGFLNSFSETQWLSLSNNDLARLPGAIGNLPRLKRLFLKHNHIVLDATANASIIGLQNLELLNLDGNPLGLLPDFSSMRRLRRLILRGTELSTWPEGVFELQHLEALDLGDNLITQVPPEVLAPAPERERATRAVNAVTNLYNNPLDEGSRDRLAIYREQTGHGFGVHPRLRPTRPGAVPADPRAAWLTGTPALQAVERQALWDKLVAEPDSADLFRLLNELRSTAEFRSAYADLQARVWRLLSAAGADTALREELFDLAAHPETCSDGVIMVFSGFEMRLLVSEAMALSSQAGVERGLMELGQGLFRLEEVERIALEVIARRRAQGIGVDEVEIRLAYRIELARDLDLPGQPTHMNYAPTANVSAADIQAAKARVLAAETPQALKRSLAERDFWLNFLRNQYPERFDAVNAPYIARLTALEADKGELNSQQYLTKIDLLQQRRRTDEQRLAQELTAQIWNNLPEQVTRL